MRNRWAGPLIALFITGGVALVLLANLNYPAPGARPTSSPPAVEGPKGTPATSAVNPGLVEHPIGEVEKGEPYALRITTVWLPSVEWDGPKVVAGTDVIHLEADIQATARNPHGFAKGSFIPYLTISYTITSEAGGPAITGDLAPMVAIDGPHYGAGVALPKPGKYRLTLNVRPPSSGGMGRHHDPVSGVAEWWQPFTAAFDWDYRPDAPGGR
ncbi:MAG TPA: iron transporter [Isosphaeraceae bacterium]|nr:iron transporter [Isosphaeraceae bacterium]